MCQPFLPRGDVAALDWMRAFAAVYGVVVDPATVADKATYQNPFQKPVGIPWVIVNGDVEVENGGRCRNVGQNGAARHHRKVLPRRGKLNGGGLLVEP